MPGEPPALFGDALRRLAAAATYLYQDGPRYWYSTQPTVTKLAEDRAEQYRRDPDKVVLELDKRLRADLRRMGDFPRVQPMPSSSADVPDELEARLVVLSVDHPYVKEAGCPAEVAARAILTTRGNAPRLYQNTLVFLAADKTRLQDLDDAARRYLAWESILAEQTVLDLSPHQVKQAETQRKGADDAVTARVPETYQWLLVPTQASPKAPVELSAIRLTGQDALAVRASRKLKNEELLVLDYAGTMLRKAMDDVPLWSGDHVPIKQLVEHFGRYLYLPRLRGPDILIEAMRDGLARLTWNSETYAFADAWDEKKAAYVGLRGGEATRVSTDSSGLLVKPEVAARQMEAQRKPDERPIEPGEDDRGRRVGPGIALPPEPPRPPAVRRFHGSVALDPARLGRDAGRIAEEIVQHLTTQKGATVSLTLEIEADLPEGASESVVRTVTENARTLKFRVQGFEAD